MPMIKLKSSDGEVFEVDLKVARRMATIRSMLEDLGLQENDEDNEPIPLPKVNAAVLKKVIEWAQYHRDDPVEQVDDDEDPKPIRVCAWDRNLLKVDTQLFKGIILASNYLNIQRLLDVTCKILADMVKEKSEEELRELFEVAGPGDTAKVKGKKKRGKAGAGSSKKKLKVGSNEPPVPKRLLRSGIPKA